MYILTLIMQLAFTIFSRLHCSPVEALVSVIYLILYLCLKIVNSRTLGHAFGVEIYECNKTTCLFPHIVLGCLLN